MAGSAQRESIVSDLQMLAYHAGIKGREETVNQYKTSILGHHDIEVAALTKKLQETESALARLIVSGGKPRA